MSWVTNVMLAVMLDDRSTADAFGAWLREECPRTDSDNRGCGWINHISGPDMNWGGYKAPECAVYAGTLNHADLTAVVAKFGEMAWRYPRFAQLLLMEQEEYHFRLWMISDGQPTQYAPTRDLTESDWTAAHSDEGEAKE